MSKKRKIAITTDGSEVWVNEGADIVNHQKVEDVYSKSVKFLKSKTKFSFTNETILSNLTIKSSKSIES